MERSTRIWEPRFAIRVVHFVGTSTSYALPLQRASVHAHTHHGTPIQVLTLTVQTGCHGRCASRAVASSLARAAGHSDGHGTPKGSAANICKSERA